MADLIRTALPLIACLTVAGCANQGVPSKVPKDVQAFLGDRIVAVLRDPQKVEVSHVRNARAGLEVVETAPVQDARFSRKFAKLFLSNDAYRFNLAKACMFNPDTLVRIFGSNGDRADFVLCFTCEEFKVTGFDPAGKPFDENRRHENFDGVTDRLQPLIDSAFSARIDPSLASH